MTAFVVVLLLLLLAVTVLGAAGLPGSSGEAKATWARAKKAFGLDSWPTRVVGPIVAVWAGVALVFLSALFWLPVFLWRHDFGAAEDPTWDLRWTFIALAAVTAALSAVIALPFTLLRTRYNARQTDAAEEGLLTDRINKAVEGLGAQKEVNRLGRTVTYSMHLDDEQRETFEERRFEWQDEKVEPPPGTYSISYGDWQPIAQTLPNLEVRIGAIYALERLAKRNLEVHVQIMEILCAYIRENAPATDDDDGPADWLKENEDDGPLEDDWEERREKYEAELRSWLAGVAPRTDIQTALTVIGRRDEDQRRVEAEQGKGWTKGFVFDRPPASTDADDQPEDDAAEMRAEVDAWEGELSAYDAHGGYRLDLRRTDLRGADLARLNFAGARLFEARLQGAWLDEARLQGAWLGRARLQGARLGRARLQGARLGRARLQGAWLDEARLQGARLGGARLQGAWLDEARLQGARLGRARLQGARLGRARLQGARLGRARLQGARLGRARLQGAWLDEARLQGARLGRARLQGAWLDEARLQGARLGRARLQGAVLWKIEVDQSTDLRADSNRASALRSVDLTECIVNTRFFEEAFGDLSNTLPEPLKAGDPPLEHWAREKLDNEAFEKAWRAWQVEIGYRQPDEAE